MRDSYRRIRTAIARINAYLQEHLTGMAVLQLFNREDRSFDEFEAANRAHMEAYKDSILAYGLFYPAVELVGVIAVAIILYMGGGMALRGAVSVGTAIAFIQYSQRFFRPIQDLSDKYNLLQAAMASSERIFKLLDTPVTIVDPPQPQPLDTPARARWNFTRSGSPTRTTTRFWTTSALPSSRVKRWRWWATPAPEKPRSPTCSCASTKCRKAASPSTASTSANCACSDLRKNFGIVLQDPFLFSGTIASNIRLGSEGITDAQVRSAAQQVNLEEFIEGLPAGFDEPVRERGATLSVGQKQLLSFARALAHNPRILVLDEATSSVDPETEHLLREGMRRLIENRTSLVIAHRLSTIQNASKIVVMHKGRVREVGTHQDLLDQRGNLLQALSASVQGSGCPGGAADRRDGVLADPTRGGRGVNQSR